MIILADLDAIDKSFITSNFIRDMLSHGYKRISDKDIQMINSHRLKNNQAVITREQIEQLITDVKDVLIELEYDNNASSDNIYYVNFFIKIKNILIFMLMLYYMLYRPFYVLFSSLFINSYT